VCTCLCVCMCMCVYMLSEARRGVGVQGAQGSLCVCACSRACVNICVQELVYPCICMRVSA